MGVLEWVKKFEDIETVSKSNLDLEVTCKVSAKAAFKWFYNDSEIAVSPKLKVQSTDNSSKLSIVGILSKTGQGEYKVVATLGNREISHSANVKVKIPKVAKKKELSPEAPVFTKELSEKEVRENVRVKIDAAVKAVPKPDIEWYRDDILLEGDRYTKEIDESRGEFQLSLIFEQSCAEDDGVYKCVAKNSGGEASTSGKLNVTIVKKEMPRFRKKPQALEVTEHDETIIDCCISGRPTPDVEWSLANAVLEESENIIFERDGEIFKLRLKNTLRTQAGIYTIKATNSQGTMSASARLKVNPVIPPKIVTPPSDCLACEQGPAKFTAKVSGSTPTILWYLNDEVLEESDSYIYTFDGKDTYTLTIDCNIDGKSGPVKIVATNAGGEDSASSKLTVDGRAPEFIEKPVKCTCLEGGTLMFFCRISGDPYPELQWKKGGKILSKDKRTSISHDTEADQHGLTITEVTKKDAGTYTLILKNKFRSIDCPATLMITDNHDLANQFAVDLKAGKQRKKPTMTEEEFIIFLRNNPKNKWPDLCDEYGFNLKRILKLMEEMDKRAALEAAEKAERDRLEKERLARLEEERLRREREAAERKKREEEEAEKYRRAQKEKEDADEAARKLKMGKAEFKFTKEIEDVTVTEKENALFECVISHKKLAVDWFINDQPIELGPKYQEVVEEFTHRLCVNIARPRDEGTIRAEFKKVTCSAQLKVIPLVPKFKTGLKDLNVPEHDTATFEIKLNDDELPVEWYLGDKKIEPSDKYEITQDEKNKNIYRLIIKDCLKTDEGPIKMSCNGVECTANLSVKATPIKFSKPLKEKHFMEKEKMEFECETSKPADVQWYKDGVLVTPNDHIQIIADGTKHKIVINKCTLEDEADWECRLPEDKTKAT